MNRVHHTQSRTHAHTHTFWHNVAETDDGHAEQSCVLRDAGALRLVELGAPGVDLDRKMRFVARKEGESAPRESVCVCV